MNSGRAFRVGLSILSGLCLDADCGGIRLFDLLARQRCGNGVRWLCGGTAMN